MIDDVFEWTRIDMALIAYVGLCMAIHGIQSLDAATPARPLRPVPQQSARAWHADVSKKRCLKL